MATKRKPWPKAARAARDDAAEQAIIGIRALRPVIENEQSLPEIDRLRREAIALTALLTIARRLADAGAPLLMDDI